MGLNSLFRKRISLAEYYAASIAAIMISLPWSEADIGGDNKYLTKELRIILMVILFSIGRDLVPKDYVLGDLPGFSNQFNKTSFLTGYDMVADKIAEFEKTETAQDVFKKMEEYIAAVEHAETHTLDVIDSIAGVLLRVVPPENNAERDSYYSRVSRVFEYVAIYLEHVFFKGHVVV